MRFILFVLVACSLIPFRNAAVGNINFQALHKFAENIPSILCGKVDALEVLMEDHLPSQLYTGTFGFQFYLRQLGRIAGQISNRFPHINILELGKSHSPFLICLDIDIIQHSCNTSFFRFRHGTGREFCSLGIRHRVFFLHVYKCYGLSIGYCTDRGFRGSYKIDF